MSLGTVITQKTWASIALLQSVAMGSALMALDYLDFPTQTLGKCAKPISILLASFFFGGLGTHYGLKKAFTAVMVCAGIAVFTLGKPGPIKGAVEVPDKWLGYMLLLVSLFCDGMIGGLQKDFEKFKDKRPTGFQMMFFINAWSFGLVLCYELAFGNILPPFAFIGKFPAVLVPLIGRCF